MSLCSPEHAGKLVFSSSVREFGDVGNGVASVGLFGNKKMVGGTLCDLDEVCDTENLSFVCKVLELFTQKSGCFPADVAVDFVEDETLTVLFVCKSYFDGKQKS